MKRAAVYMLFDAKGVVGEYVVHKLDRLREHVQRIVVVSNGPLRAEGRSALEALGLEVVERENVGFDVWAYRAGLEHLGWDALAQYDELLLLNYTFYAPIFPFAELFTEMGRRAVDFWGITAFRGPVPNAFTGHGVIPYHLQSHFIAVRKAMLSAPAFREYWQGLPPIESYIDSIVKHEIVFTEHFEALGFRHSCFADASRYADVHPALNGIDLLLNDRVPILKRRPFFHDPIQLDRECSDLARALEIVERESNFDLSLVWKDIGRVAKPRDLYTNTTHLRILSDEPSVTPRQSRLRIAALVHAYVPDMVPEILARIAHIPAPVDVWFTTADDERRARVAAHATASLPASVTLREIRVVPNRGRDVSAHLIGLRDVALSGDYDLVCRLHTKQSLQDPFAMSRHFREHLFENLLSSRPYLERLLALVESEPSIGLVMPPAIHQGYPVLGGGWFENRRGAEEWAKRLGLDVPFDDSTPLAAYGSMYWYRPRALRALFSYPFTWDDFPAEGAYRDGSLAHVLERLIAYAAQASGHTIWCVQNARHAEKSYVRLEFKLQAAMANEKRTVKVSDDAVLPHMKALVRRGLRPAPSVLSSITSSYRAVRAAYHLMRRLRPK